MILDYFCERLTGINKTECDLFISALGYETRCTSLLRSNCISASEFLFLEFPDSNVEDFEANVNFVMSLGRIERLVYNKPSFLDSVVQRLSRRGYDEIVIDVSSMNRHIISNLILALAVTKNVAKCTLAYVPAKYWKPDPTLFGIQNAGPVSHDFTNWAALPDRQHTIYVGLGHELGVALGLVNIIEPEQVFAYYSTGHDNRFETDVREANANFEFPCMSVDFRPYDLLNPQLTYRVIERSIRLEKETNQVTLIPMGPKLLSVVFSLLAIRFWGHTNLWRVIHRPKIVNTIPASDYVTFGIDLEELRERVSHDETLGFLSSAAL